jgi:imidazolonepropionase-like amidohydrolase
MTPQQALYAATITPAEFFNMADTRGRLTKGMQADLVLLKDNPLTDIRHSRSVEAVMLAGEWVRK